MMMDPNSQPVPSIWAMKLDVGGLQFTGFASLFRSSNSSQTYYLALLPSGAGRWFICDLVYSEGQTWNIKVNPRDATEKENNPALDNLIRSGVYFEGHGTIDHDHATFNIANERIPDRVPMKIDLTRLEDFPDQEASASA